MAANHSELILQRSHVWRRAILLILLFVGLGALASLDALHAALVEVLAASERLIAAYPLFGAVLFILFAAVSAMFAFVSVAAIVPVALFTWGAFFGAVLLWVGWIIGGLCAYSIGRVFGRRAVLWLTSDADVLKRIETRLRSTTPFALVLLFQLALPSEIPGYVLGLVNYSLPRYLLSLALAELPYTVATVALGRSFVARQSAVLMIVGALLVAFSIGAFYVLRRRLSADHDGLAS